MKKYFLLLLAAFPALTATAQTRGVKIAYIDMEYILEKVPDYAEAKNQLESKAQKWKQEIEVKKTEITKLKDGLKAEKALLTKELLEEREEEIRFLETELLEFQEKRFGPRGDLISQKAVLVKPIQDQVFTVVQDISEQRKYDFVFDKSSDLTMLFAANRHDISDLVVRRLTRTARAQQLSPKELKQLEEEEAKEDLMSDPEHQDMQKKLDDKKAERERKLAERKALQEQKRLEYEQRREQMIRDREAKKNGTTAPATTTTTPKPSTGTPAGSPDDTDDDVPAGNANRPATTPSTTTTGKPVTTQGTTTVQGENAKEVKTTATDTPEEGQPETVNKQNAAQEAQAERARKLDERKKAIEERRQKILAEREAAKKAREQQNQTPAPTQENKDE